MEGGIGPILILTKLTIVHGYNLILSPYFDLTVSKYFLQLLSLNQNLTTINTL